MENYELYIEAPPKRLHNWFPKNHVPFNKGLKWSDYLDMRKAKRMKKYLELGRAKGSRDKLHEINRIPIVGIKDGKLIAFKSASDAEGYIRALGIKINRRNINKVCNGSVSKCRFGKREYTCIRRRAGGYQWFFANEVEKYKDLIY